LDDTMAKQYQGVSKQHQMLTSHHVGSPRGNENSA
jgi:hypothetical protein